MPTRNDVIHEILGKCRIDYIKKLLDQGALDRPQNSTAHSTPLDLAVFLNRKDVVSLLLDFGEDIDFPTNGRTPLMQAVFWGHKEVVQLLIERGAFIDKSEADNSKDSVISSFAEKDLETLKLLLNAGLDLNRRDNYALAKRALMDDNDVLKLLFENGLYLDETDKRFKEVRSKAWLYKRLPEIKNMTLLFKEYNDQKGLKPLPWYKKIFSKMGKREVFEAIQLGQTKKLKNLFQYNELSDELKLEFLYESIKRNQIQVARLLIEENAPLYDAKNKEMSPLLYAIEKGRNLMALLLIEKGSDVNFKTKEGSLLLKAVQKAEACVVEKLIDYGALMNEGDGDISPLMSAVQQKRYPHFKKLIEMTADLDFQDQEGNTSLMKAIENGFMIGAKTLIEHGADMLIKNKAGEDAYHFAMKTGEVQLAKMIQRQLKEKLKYKQNQAAPINQKKANPVVLILKNKQQHQRG